MIREQITPKGDGNLSEREYILSDFTLENR